MSGGNDDPKNYEPLPAEELQSAQADKVNYKNPLETQPKAVEAPISSPKPPQVWFDLF